MVELHEKSGESSKESLGEELAKYRSESSASERPASTQQQVESLAAQLGVQADFNVRAANFHVCFFIFFRKMKIQVKNAVSNASLHNCWTLHFRCVNALRTP
jgi:hypothetical protein